DDDRIRVVGEADSGATAVELAKKLRPRVIVMDMAMPGLDGLQATREILKHAIDVDLAQAILDVASGKQVLGPGLQKPALQGDDDYDRLTPREKQILQLIAQGNSNKEIAAMLNLSVNTVRKGLVRLP